MKVDLNQWNANGFVCEGQMEVKDIPKTLLEFERKAKDLLDSTGARSCRVCLEAVWGAERKAGMYQFL